MVHDHEKVESLVAQIKHGNREAFGALYDLFSADLFRFLIVLARDVQEAQDLTSETFVRVWRSIDRYQKGNFRSYIFMIARNLALDALRKRKRASVHIENEEDLIDLKSSPLLDAVRSEEDKHMYQALMELSEEYRTIISLRFMNGMSTKEVAELIGKSEAAVKITQHRAMVKLREKLKRHA